MLEPIEEVKPMSPEDILGREYLVLCNKLTLSINLQLDSKREELASRGTVTVEILSEYASVSDSVRENFRRAGWYIRYGVPMVGRITYTFSRNGTIFS